MRFLADENLEKPIVDWLREKGYDVLYIAEKSQSIKDEKIINLARKENRILITNDKDFGELVFHHGQITSGIILIRSKDKSSEKKLKLVKQVLKEIKNKIRGNFIVVNENGIRIKKIL
jgi:predicted nuclease of predicted toxin-antitoxin system